MANDIKWSIDPSHSDIGFKVRHLMISHVKGTFKAFDASIYTTGKDFTTAVIDVWVDAASITTGDAQRDEHLKGSDFFDVQSHRQITFSASTISAAATGLSYEVWGELQMRGVTKNIKLDVEFGGIAQDPYGQEKAGFTITGKLNRSDWGLVWNAAIETGGVIVSDEISILCEIQLINKGKEGLKMTLEPDVNTVGTV